MDYPTVSYDFLATDPNPYCQLVAAMCAEVGGDIPTAFGAAPALVDPVRQLLGYWRLVIAAGDAAPLLQELAHAGGLAVLAKAADRLAGLQAIEPFPQEALNTVTAYTGQDYEAAYRIALYLSPGCQVDQMVAIEAYHHPLLELFTYWIDPEGMLEDDFD